MQEYTNYKTLYVDIDDTLLMSNLSEYPEGQQIDIQYTNGSIRVVPNQKNINLVVLFYKLGYNIIFWSKTGGDWAAAAARVLDLENVVSVCLTKPTFYMDDKDVTEWIGPRRYREAQ